MMRNYLTNFTPDSFSGIIFALEGVKRSIVLLNGPTGCKFFHSATSDNQTIRQSEFDPFNFTEKWYFGQPRVPCTFLDNGDYVYGSKDKLTEALTFFKDNTALEMICIVNSPGAALIGDDLEGIAAEINLEKPIITIETPGFSTDISMGYETGVMELLRQLSLKSVSEPIAKTVNLLGLSIYHKNYLGDIAELKRLLSLVGIEVNCVLCADCSFESIQKLPAAALNIVIHPEYGLKIAQYLKERFGTPFFLPDGPPIGFSATEKFIYGVSNLVDGDTTAFTAECNRGRARAYAFISRVNSLTGLPKGTSFAVEGSYSELYSYTSFLVHYFGMIPHSINVLNDASDCFCGKLLELCDELGVTAALNGDFLETNAELVFGSGNTIAALKARKHQFTGIETCLPSLGYIDVIPKTHLGVKGALTLVEQVINGLIF